MKKRGWWIISGVLFIHILTGCSNSSSHPLTAYTITTTEAITTLPKDAKEIRVFPGPFVWGSIQTTAAQSSNEWNWQTTDEFVEQLKNNNLEAIAIIWPYALWDQATCHAEYPEVITMLPGAFSKPYAPCDAEAYTAFVTALVQRYGDTITYWEIMSQPEQQLPPNAFFIGTANEYYQIHTLSHSTIKQINESAMVVNGSLSAPDTTTIQFWSPLWENNLADYTDAIAVNLPADTNVGPYTSWLAEYTITDPVWITRTPQEKQFEGVAKVFYTQ